MLRALTLNELATVSAGAMNNNVEAIVKTQNLQHDLYTEMYVGAVLGFMFIGTPLVCIAGFTQYRYYVWTPVLIGTALGSLIFPLLSANERE